MHQRWEHGTDMQRANLRPDWQRALVTLTATVVVATLVLFSYWAKAILIPLALAVFFTFVLTPVERTFESWRLGRIPSVTLTVGLSLVAFGLTGWLLTQQVSSLTRTLPDHAQRIKTKLQSAREWFVAGDNERLGKLFDELSEIVAPSPREELEAKANGRQTQVVVGGRPFWMSALYWLIGPFLEILAQVAFSMVLVFFMLLRREDLRNRFLRIAIRSRMATALKAVDDASTRVSRYLLTQLLVNASYGLCVGAGLTFLGVEYALLWGFLAGLFRYLPFIGAWVGGALPFVFSFVTSSGWWEPLAVAGLIVVLEILCSMLAEPLLFGASLGMSEFAQLLTAAVWAFLWGPVGLVLASPLTVCLLILGKYVPQFKVLEILLGDEPPLEASVALFQRLAARDQDEASRIVLRAARAGSFALVLDRVVLPALVQIKTAALNGDLSSEEVRDILAITEELLEELEALPCDQPSDLGTAPEADDASAVRLLACPARDEFDRFVLRALATRLDKAKWNLTIASETTLASEVITAIEETDPAMVIISSLPPGGVAHTRYLCKRLSQRFPNLPLVVGRWTEDAVDEALRQEFESAGIEKVVESVQTAEQHLGIWAQALQKKAIARDDPMQREALALHV